MADYAQRYSDAQADKLSKRFAKVYGQAAKEIDGKLKSFKKQHEIIDGRMRQKVKSGEITEKQYQQWLKGQVFQGKQWENKLKSITETYVNADKKARELLGETSKNVFAEAGNYQAYRTGIDVNGAVAFDMYDRKTVDRLIKDRPQLLPEWKIDEPKDYKWNYNRVNNAVTQGILQGESVYDIGKRLTADLSAKNASKMDMFARTAITGAQNSGRIERLHEAEEMGIKVKKRWLAAHDDRVRDAHADLDGVEVDVDEPFHSLLGDIDYPGDPTADPANVYNCRCTLIYVYPEYKDKQHFEEHQTYAEWKAEQEKSGNVQQKIHQKMQQEDNNQYTSYSKKIEFTDVFTTEQQNSVESVLQMATNEYELPYEFDYVGDGRIPRNLPHESLWDLRDEYPERKMDFGEAAQYVSIKKENGIIERRIDIIDDGMSATPLSEMYDSLYALHKKFDSDPSISNALFNAGVGIEGTVLHEYGHAIQDYCGFFIRKTEEGKKFEDWLRQYARSNPMDILSISRYAGESVVKDGSVNPSELWAEAFVTSFDPNHDTTAWKTANKIMTEFNRRFGHMFNKRR